MFLLIVLEPIGREREREREREERERERERESDGGGGGAEQGRAERRTEGSCTG